jgi:enoyl-CoA hydratase/carnithine racemase
MSPSGRAGFARAAACDDRPTRSTEHGADVSPFRGSAAFTEEWKHFDFTLDDGVATVTFSRPDKLNALTFDVYADLRDLLSELPHRGDAQVLVVTGEGRGFCSGGDVDEIIGELQKLPTGELLAFTRMSGAVVKSMRDSPLPVVAAVNGVAAGAGAVLALAADFRLLAPTAKFSFLFTRVGLAGADMGAAYLLPRLVGLGRATELLVLGDEVSAERAVELGLASRVAEDLPAAAQELARTLADGPALAYATTKLLLTRELDLDLGGAIEMEALAQALLMKSDDFGEFYAAWSEGRSPAWSGR